MRNAEIIRALRKIAETYDSLAKDAELLEAVQSRLTARTRRTTAEGSFTHP